MIAKPSAVSLHLFHRDMCKFVINKTSMVEVVRLVEYTVPETSSYSGRAGGVRIELRKLVVRFMAWKSNKLMEFSSFRSLLEGGGECVSELFNAIMKSRAEVWVRDSDSDQWVWRAMRCDGMRPEPSPKFSAVEETIQGSDAVEWVL